MLKRAAAILFVLVMAGQVWAGVCHCLEGGDHGKSSCCKREKISGDRMLSDPCCGTEACADAAPNSPRFQKDTTVKIPLPAEVPADETPIWPAFQPDLSNAIARTASFGDLRASIPRPPNLYILHHAFLI